MRRLPFNEAADWVKGSLDIVDIVSRHVVLKKAGRNHLGLCPFHPEKTPSFNVNREKRLFKCFGCGESGDALAFLMKRENKTYGEIIRDLASEQGIEIIIDGQSAEKAEQTLDLKQKILELNQKAHQWFQEQLNTPEGQSVGQYLESRQIHEAIRQEFGLGFAPAGWENLTQYFFGHSQTVKQTPDLLVTAGISNPRAEGQGYYDRFRNRLIIPIHDEQGRVVGFGGRALSDEDKPKYLNSPETPVYIKNRVLYGLFQAKESIRQTRSAVVMEGYFDVISAHWGGIKQAVGSCGTALTENHLKLLTRFGAETVYLAFDSDEAGLKATLSAIELIEPYLASASLSLKVITVPSGKDPDEYIRQFGGDAFGQLLNEAKPYLEFKLDMAIRGLDLHSPEGRVTAANRLTPLIAGIGQPILRLEILRNYAERLSLSEEALALEVKRFEQLKNPTWTKKSNNFKNFSKKGAIFDRPLLLSKRSKSQIPENVAELRKPLAPKHIVAEIFLLKLLLMNTEGYRLMYPFVNNLTFSLETHQLLLDAIRVFGTLEDTLEDLLQKLQGEFTHREELQRLYTDFVFSAESLEEQLGLRGLPPSLYREKLLREAQKSRAIIEEYQQKEKMRHLADQAKGLERIPHPQETEERETSLLELQYQLRDKLSRRNEK